MQKVFLLLSTDHIGGAEKRFIGLWEAVCSTEKDLAITLVLSPALYQMLQNQEGYAAALTKFQNRVIQWNISGRFRKFRSSLRRFVDGHTEKQDILHFIGDHPLLPGLGRRQVYSITQSSLKNLNNSGKAGHFAGIAFSDIIDILDPRVYEQISRWFFYKKKRLYRTANSFCDTRLFHSLPFSEKKDWFVFLGRFEPMKQVCRLLDQVPSIYEAIRPLAGNDLQFYFFGHGSLESEMEIMMKEDRFTGLPITISYLEQPSEILAQSKVFFSLQWHNNYPSRSLIEAMAAGNIPLVTDVGQTRWLARPEFSYYVPEHFNREDMIRAVTEIYKTDPKELEEKSVMARQFILEHHTVEKMRDYYLGLYKAC
jgi:glycosyltransferase involved in cell wall biosynthesis